MTARLTRTPATSPATSAANPAVTPLRARRRPRARRLVAGALTGAVLALAAGTVTPAAATTRHPHATYDAGTQLVSGYASLSAGLIDLYAHKSGQTLDEYLSDQQVLLTPATLPASQAPGTPTLGDDAPALDPTAAPSLDPSSLGSLGSLDIRGLSADGGLLLTADQLGQVTGGASATRLRATDLASLDGALRASGVGLPRKQYRSLSSLAADVTRAARTPDGAVTLAAAKWARDLGTLRSPALSMPNAPTAAMPTVPASALPFGLLMDKSLTNLVLNSPDLISAAQDNAGLGSPKLLKAWNRSMAQAYAATGHDLTSMLPSPCTGVMMGVMASGHRSHTTDCPAACNVAGMYLHYQSGAAFDSSQNSLESNVTNPAGNVLNYATLTNMSSWAQNAIVAQNPQLVAPGANSAPASGPSDCMSASDSARNTLSSQLPGMFASLR